MVQKFLKFLKFFDERREKEIGNQEIGRLNDYLIISIIGIKFIQLKFSCIFWQYLYRFQLQNLAHKYNSMS